jgi:hypothetical protein
MGEPSDLARLALFKLSRLIVAHTFWAVERSMLAQATGH